MKKLYYVACILGTALLVGTSGAFAQKASSVQAKPDALAQKAKPDTPIQKMELAELPQKIEQANQAQQTVAFFEKLAQKDPAKFAAFLLGGNSSIYLYNPNVLYIGIKGTDEVFVVCQVEDSDLGTFYHVIHKKNGKITTQDAAAIPTPQDFTTLFKRGS